MLSERLGSKVSRVVPLPTGDRDAMAPQDEWIPRPGFIIGAIQGLDRAAVGLASTVLGAVGAASRGKIPHFGGRRPEVVVRSPAWLGHAVGDVTGTDCAVGLLTDDAGVVIAPCGAFDDAALPFLREKLIAALADYPPFVCIDLTLVDALCPSGIALIELARERVGHYGGSCSVACGHTTMRRMFEDHGLVEVRNRELGA
jgi:anti-anti-sigma regulatory factor